MMQYLNDPISAILKNSCFFSKSTPCRRASVMSLKNTTSSWKVFSAWFCTCYKISYTKHTYTPFLHSEKKIRLSFERFWQHCDPVSMSGNPNWHENWHLTGSYHYAHLFLIVSEKKPSLMCPRISSPETTLHQASVTYTTVKHYG